MHELPAAELNMLLQLSLYELLLGRWHGLNEGRKKKGISTCGAWS